MKKQPDTIRPSIFDGYNQVVAGQSTRIGGVSESPFDTLNLGSSTADDLLKV